MKKIFSLFLSLMLVFTMTLGNVAFVGEAADDGSRFLIKSVFDTSGKAYTDYNSEISSYFVVNYMTKEAHTTDTEAFQIRSTRPDKTMRFVVNAPEVNGSKPTDGVYTFSGKMLGNKANSDGDIDFSAARIQFNRTSSGNDGAIALENLTANTWLDFSYTLDLDNGEYIVKYRNPADEEGVYEFEETVEFDANTAFSSLYFQLLYSDTASIVAFKDLKYTASMGDVKESSIISVNDGALVPARQKNLTFTISEDIPTLEASHITAAPDNGEAVNTASSVGVTLEDDGTYTVDVSFDQRFTESTSYTLNIDPDVYEGFKAINDDGSLSDVDTSGLSASFDVDEYVIDPTGTGVLVKTFYDTVGKPFSGYSTILSKSHNPMYMESAETAVKLPNVTVYNNVRTNINGAIALERLTGADIYVQFANPLESTTPGRYVINGKFYTNKAKTDGSGLADLSSGVIGLNRQSGKYDASHNVAGSLKASTWYNFTFEIDLLATPNTFKVEYIADGAAAPAYSDTKTFSTGKYGGIRLDVEVSDEYSSFNEDGYYLLYKDLKMEYFSAKTKILSVNDDNAVAPNQKELVFTISEDIIGLTDNPGWISVEDSMQNEIKATAVTVTGTQSPYTVTATLAENLGAWSEYNLILSSDMYDGMGELNESGDIIEPVQMPEDEFTKVFSTASTGFDMREKSINSDSSNVSYVMEYTNSESTCEPVTMLLAVYDATGKMTGLTAKSVQDADLPVNGATKEVSISAPYSSQNTAKLFAVNGWSGKAPHFGRSWNVGQKLSDVESYSSAEQITLGEFDYNDYTISVGFDTLTGAETSGALYVYNTSSALSDTALPVYADYVTTTPDGTYLAQIPFFDSIDDSTATYKVEFYSSVLSDGISAEFTCYDAEDRDNQKRQIIYDGAKASTTLASLMQAIKGTDSNDNVINDNFEVFLKDAGTSTYNSLKNQNAVFSKMLSKLSSVNNYVELVALFDSCVNAQYYSETSPVSGGGGGGGGGYVSSDNKNYGSSSVVVSESVSSSQVTTEPEDESTQASWKNPFADMTGHWAEEFAAVLSERGIMKGYPDGSFKGEASITRAELAKTIVEALEIEAVGSSKFTDVSGDAWYADYITKAAAAGIVNGYEDGSFGPDVAVNRQDAVLMLYRALGTVMELPTGYTFFTDDFDISDYASDAVRCLGELGIVKGDPDVRFNPLNGITRAEVATIICRALDYIESH